MVAINVKYNARKIMKISTKGKYALRVMVDIATAKVLPISLSDIATKQNISVKYLEQIAAILKDNGLVVSERGANGGYKLAKASSRISVAEILTATGDNPKFAACVDTICPKSETCKTGGIWITLSKMINDYLSNLSLSDLINQSFKI